MNIKALCFAILMALSIPAKAQDIASKYDVIPLGMLRASNLNNNSVVVGVVAGKSRSADKAAVWQEGKITEFKLPSGYTEANLNSVNNKNVIVGSSILSRARQVRGFIWEDGNFTWLPMGSFTRVTPIGVNNNNAVVGVASGNLDEQRPFLFNSKLQDLGNLGSPVSQAIRINDNGLIVGWSRIAGPKVAEHAFKFENGKMIDLTPESNIKSWAYGVNNDNEIVGSMEVNSKRRAVLWSGDKTTFLTSDFGIARGININKVVVGTMEVPFEQTIEGEVFRTSALAAFVWSKGVLVDLNKRIDSKLGWTLGQGLAINDKGEVLVLGTKDGRPQAALLKPAL